MFLFVVMIVSLCSFSGYAASATSFSDVPADHWAYSYIMKMTEMGLFNGTSEPVDGIGTFDPSKSMTRAEFLTVVVRYLYKDKMGQLDGADWFTESYIIAFNEHLIEESYIDEETLNDPIPRQQMAYILTQALEAKGETTDGRLSDTAIPDYKDIGGLYKDSVKVAYKMGLLVGTDDKGTFNPQGVLTRAEATTALYRLIFADARKPYTPTGVDMSSDTTPEGYVVDPSKAVGNYNWSVGADQTRENITFNEGATHAIPIEGDIVVKSDGTQVVIGYTNGILRAEGCDIWTGATLANGTKITGEGSLGCFVNDKTSFKKGANGELYTEAMWNHFARNVVMPSRQGSYDGEIANGFFIWTEYENEYGTFAEWTWAGR